MSDPAATSEAPKPLDPRARIVDGLMQLAAERGFEEISIRDICAAANVTLADFRDAFPSKGAVLGGFTRRVDRKVLADTTEAIAADSARDRLFDVLMRRFDAMAPYRDGLRGVYEWLRREPMAMLAMNQGVVNSLRFMLEAAGVDSDGMVGTVKLQGLALAYARVFAVWLEDAEPGFAKTMAALDRELTRGERWVSGVEQIDRFAAPLRAIARAAMDSRSRARDAFRRRPREATPGGESEAL
jgi:AcrR family transcriptional regulator